MILHFTNPLDNDTSWLPCNMPLGVYLTMWAVMLTVTSLLVKINTVRCHYEWLRNVPSQSDAMKQEQNEPAVTPRRIEKNKHSIKQLNGTGHYVLTKN